MVAVLFLTASASLSLARPVQAAPADLWGYAYQNHLAPPAWTQLTAGHQWGSWKLAHPGDWASARHLGTGRYQVRFPWLASGSKGIVHITPVAAGPRFCAAVAWFSAGADKIVEVNCAAPGGALTDSKFTVMFTLGSGGLAAGVGAQAYLRSDTGASYNSTGGVNSFLPTGVGTYKVTLRGVGAGGNLQVTAIAAATVPPRCKILDWVEGADVVARISCYHGATNAPFDTAFTVSYHRERAVTGVLPAPMAYTWTGGVNFNVSGITDIGALYVVAIPSSPVSGHHALITAQGAGAAWCQLFDPWFSLDEEEGLLLDFKCVDAAGVATDSAFFASYTSR